MRKKKLTEKQKEIRSLEKEQLKLLKQAVKITKLPLAKRANTALSRAFKIVAICIRANQLQQHKNIIASQPTPDFPEGGVMIKPSL